MATIRKSTTISVRIHSTPERPMTASALRDFVAALDAEGIPGDAEIHAEHDGSTEHFTGVWVEVTAEIGRSLSGNA